MNKSSDYYFNHLRTVNEDGWYDETKVPPFAEKAKK